MVKDAEAHAEDDRRQRELVEARNNAENAAYSAEKNLSELGDSVDASSKESIEAAIKDVRGVLESENVDEIREKTDALQTVWHSVSEQIYANATQAESETASASNGASADGDAAAEGDEEFVDAEVVEGEGRD